MNDTPKKAPVASGGDVQEQQANYSTETSAQLARLQAALESGRAVSTIQARSELNIIHAPARVLTLRKRGLNIVTHFRTEFDPEGRPHRRIGVYTLENSGGAD